MQGETEGVSTCRNLEGREDKTTPDESGVEPCRSLGSSLILRPSLGDLDGRRLGFRCRDYILDWLVHGRFQRREDDAGGLLDDFKALGEECRVAVIKLNVVGGCPPRIESNRPADHERDCLGLGLTHGLRGRRAALGLVQHLVSLCSAQHKHTYVVFAVMLRSG